MAGCPARHTQHCQGPHHSVGSCKSQPARRHCEHPPLHHARYFDYITCHHEALQAGGASVSTAGAVCPVPSAGALTAWSACRVLRGPGWRAGASPFAPPGTCARLGRGTAWRCVCPHRSRGHPPAARTQRHRTAAASRRRTQSPPVRDKAATQNTRGSQQHRRNARKGECGGSVRSRKRNSPRSRLHCCRIHPRWDGDATTATAARESGMHGNEH